MSVNKFEAYEIQIYANSSEHENYVRVTLPYSDLQIT
jgi:hypothetical protein